MPATAASVHCPVEDATVDIERCASCAWRSASRATCAGEERAEAREWHALMRLIP